MDRELSFGMRVTRVARCFSSRVCQKVDEFFELYGRPSYLKGGSTDDVPSTELYQLKETASDVARTCEEALARFRTRLYASPQHVPAELCRETLIAMRRVVSKPADRNTVRSSKLWQDALSIHGLCVPTDMEAAAATSDILYYGGHYGDVVQRFSCERYAAEMEMLTISEAPLLLGVRLLSTYLMACAKSRGAVDAATMQLITRAFQLVRSVTSTAEKANRQRLARAAEVLTWSLDEAYGAACLPSTTCIDTFRRDCPQWLTHLFEDPNGVTDLSCLPTDRCLTPPRLLLRAAEAAAAGRQLNILWEIYNVVKTRECQQPEYLIFGLSAEVAALIVRAAPQHPGTRGVVAYVGSSLDPEALALLVETKHSWQMALRVLSSMGGSAAYFAMRSIVLHRPPGDAQNLQESVGDLLTCNAQSTWRTALARSMAACASLETNWRASLPETLRLLSDAGKGRLFMTLLPEYDIVNAQDNLSVAASFSRVLRVSGKWWHALEVLDLIANAKPPQDEMSERFLEEACADTISTLQEAKRWRDALDTFKLLQPAMPRRGCPLLCSLLKCMPSSTPWIEALVYAERTYSIPAEVKTALTLLHDPTAPATLKGPEIAPLVPQLISHGRWQILLAYAQEHPKMAAHWVAYLRSLDRAADDVSLVAHEVLSKLPELALSDRAVLPVLFQVCMQNGWLGNFLDLLMRRIGAATLEPVVAQYQSLAQYIINRQLPPTGMVYQEPYVVHQFALLIAAKSLHITVSVPPNVANSKDSLSTYLRVPSSSIKPGRASKDHSTQFVVRGPRACPIPPEYCLFRGSSGVVVGYKAPGAPLYSVARGLLVAISEKDAFSLAYNMGPATSGLFILYLSRLNSKRMILHLQLDLLITPLQGASATPLLASSFFSEYAMVVRATTEQVYTVQASLHTRGGHRAKNVLRELKASLNRNGWGVVEPEQGCGDVYHISKIQIRLIEAKTAESVDTCGEVVDVVSSETPPWLGSNKRI